jgi:CelD/BcsL family acetyltransferase involved in cellulose biosynthesis
VTTEVRSTLGPLAGEWDTVVDRMRRPSPFLRSWWLDGVGGSDAQYVLAFDGDRLIGGLPVALDRRRGVRRCRLAGSGALAPHNLDVVAAPDDETAVVGAFADFVEQTEPGLVDLFGVDPESALARHAPASTRTEPIDAAPWIDGRPTFEAYLTSRRRKLRQELRRVERRLDEAGLTYRPVDATDTADTDRALQTFEQLHRLRWGDDSLLLPQLADLVRALRAGVGRGEVCLQEVVAGDHVVASLASIEIAGIASWYQMGRDRDPRWSNAGTFLKAHAVERSCRLGHSRIDLCIGAARQKVEWSDGRRPVVRVRWARGMAGRAVMGGLVALERLADARPGRRAAAL